MIRINEIIEHVAGLLKGTDAFIQIQVNNQYYARRVGNQDRLSDHPVVFQQEESSCFIDWMEQEMQKRPIAPSTIQNHKTCIRLLRQFYNHLSFSDLTPSCLMDFDKHLREEHYKQNTIGKIMSILRVYVRLAISEDLLRSNPFRKYRLKTEQTHKEALTEKEVGRLESRLELLTSDEQAVAKGFLFAVYTGLRYSDVSQIRRKNIKRIGRNEWLIVKMQKTGAEVHIPLSKIFGGRAMKLVDKKKDILFPMPCNTKSNQILNKVMKKCGIKKHITMHCARVTCATLSLMRGMPITTIQQILGHRDVKTTSKVYAHVTDHTLLNDIKKCWKTEQ